MANAFYISITGETQGEIKGDVEQESREGMMRGYSFSNSTTIPRHADTGQPSGTRTHHPIVFSKHVDRSSPMLWQAVCTGESLDSTPRSRHSPATTSQAPSQSASTHGSSGEVT